MTSRATLQCSIRRELWEHRAIWVAPLALAALIVLAFVYNAERWSAPLRALSSLDPAKRMLALVMPYGLAASAILLSGWLVGVFYALDALNGERRDRSILFWKSMPVSDVTTVIAKAAIPLVVLPLVVIAIALATQFVMLVASTAILAAKGISPALPWTAIPWLHTTIGMLYGMAAHSLWFAPIFGYLLVVSAAARRAPFLWAFLPIFAAYAVETIAFGSGYVATLVKHRVVGGMNAFKPDALREPITSLAQLDPIGFLGSPGLWLGLVFAVACIAAAIRLRRYRDPI